MKIYKVKGEAKVKKADEIISQANGRFFGAAFVKKDGSLRTGQFRTGVAKHVKGVGLNYNPKDYGLRGVHEQNNAEGAKGAEAYRMLNLETLTMLKVDGEEYHFE